MESADKYKCEVTLQLLITMLFKPDSQEMSLWWHPGPSLGEQSLTSADTEAQWAGWPPFSA